MKALSVKQPFAEQIASGEKKIEYRDWRFQPRYRGPLLIVSCSSPAWRLEEKLPLGEAICVVDLVRIDKYEWILENPRRCKKGIKIRGRLKLYDVPGDITDFL